MFAGTNAKERLWIFHIDPAHISAHFYAHFYAQFYLMPLIYYCYTSSRGAVAIDNFKGQYNQLKLSFRDFFEIAQIFGQDNVFAQENFMIGRVVCASPAV